MSAIVRIMTCLMLLCAFVAAKEMADGCGMNPLLALVAVADKTGNEQTGGQTSRQTDRNM